MHFVRRRNAVERIAVAKGWVLRSSRYAADERGECLLRREKALIPFREKAPRGIHRSAVLRDESEIGAMAARELLESGFGDYAFVPHPGNPKWSREREAGFASAIRAAGKRFIRRRRPETPSDSTADWIAVLPRPVGVFAANDMDAVQYEPSVALAPAAVHGIPVITTMLHEGATFRNALGEEFLPDKHANKDALSRAIFAEIEAALNSVP